LSHILSDVIVKALKICFNGSARILDNCKTTSLGILHYHCTIDNSIIPQDAF